MRVVADENAPALGLDAIEDDLGRGSRRGRRLVAERARAVERDGYLVLGAAETVVGLTDSFKPLSERRGLYVPNSSPRAAAPRLAVVAGGR